MAPCWCLILAVSLIYQTQGHQTFLLAKLLPEANPHPCLSLATRKDPPQEKTRHTSRKYLPTHHPTTTPPAHSHKPARQCCQTTTTSWWCHAVSCSIGSTYASNAASSASSAPHCAPTPSYCCCRHCRCCLPHCCCCHLPPAAASNAPAGW